MTTFHVSAHPWHAPLQKPLFWWALGFPLRDHHFLAEVLHTQLKNAMLLLYGLAWLMVFWPRSWVRAFSRRQRWAAIMGVSLSLAAWRSHCRTGRSCVGWAGFFELCVGWLDRRVGGGAALGSPSFVADSGPRRFDGRGANAARCPPTQPHAVDGLDVCGCGLDLLATSQAKTQTLEQAFGARQMAGLRAAFHVEPAEQAPQMHLDSMLADLQFFGNVAVAQASV